MANRIENLAIVSSLPPDGCGGAIESLRAIREQFNGRATLYYPGSSTSHTAEEYLVEVPARFFDGVSYSEPAELEGLVRMLHRHPLVLFNDTSVFATTTATALSRSSRNTAVIWRTEVKDKDPCTFPTPRAWELYKKVYRPLQKSAVRATGANLAVSDTVAADVRKLRGEHTSPVFTIPEQVSGPYSPGLRTSELHTTTREKYLKPYEMGVLLVSRLDGVKNLVILPDLLRELRKSLEVTNTVSPYSNVCVRLVGPKQHPDIADKLLQSIEDMKRSDIKAGLSERVKFQYNGPADKETLNELYSTHEIFLFPSKSEGFGRVTVEALKCGCVPIGYAHCAATREILTGSDTQVGALFDTPRSAADLILKFMSDPSTLQQLRYNGMNYASSEYEPSKAMGVLEAVLTYFLASL